MTRNRFTLATIFAIFVLALLVVFPAAEGILFKKGFQLGLDLDGGISLVFQADLSSVEADKRAEVIDGIIAVISNRINPLGVTEPNIEKQGTDRIAVELPGADLSDVQKERIGRTALLEFREQARDEEGKIITDDEGNVVWIPATGIVDGQELVLTSSYFKESTYIARGQLGEILLIFEWDNIGSQLSEQITSRLIGEPLGIFEGDDPMLGDDGLPIAPRINSVITDSGQIEGLSLNEATELSHQLNAGRLPVPLTTIFEATVTPTLGADFVNLSLKAGFIGLALVMLFMILYYRLPGLVASLALIFYGALVMAVFKLVPVTLTLAGIGGFILSIGMAVDANVLIFERLREELRAGRTLGAAIEAGFSRAWAAIRDSNFTTFIVCAILFWVGSSVAGGDRVMGFALTLGFGVAVSMFTAIMVTRSILRVFARSRLAKRRHLFVSRAGEAND